MSKTLHDSMGDFIGFMKTHTDPIHAPVEDETTIDAVMTPNNVTEANEALQELLGEQLLGEIEDNNLVTWEHDSDGDRPNYDNLIEWINMYYDLREK